jgi:AraC-like DNA-binding protein
MEAAEPSVPPLAFVQLLASDALEPDAVRRFRAVLDREGLSETTLVERDIQAPVRWFREVYPTLDADTATSLGRACADQAQLTTFGPLSLPLVSAGSVGEIVELLTYLPLISTALSPHFHSSERGLTVGFTGQADDPDLNRLVVTYCGSALVRLLKLLVGELSDVTLHLDWPTPPSLQGDPDVEMGRLVFDAPLSYLYVPTETLSEVCRFSDPIAYRHAIADLEKALQRQSRPNSCSRLVRRLLEEGPGMTGSRSVASQLAISHSSLKRRLAQEGTTFRALRETVLREQAVLLLLERTSTVSEIAAQLGYSEVSNFSHAFKRWTGFSPSQFQSSQGPNRIDGGRATTVSPDARPTAADPDTEAPLQRSVAR